METREVVEGLNDFQEYYETSESFEHPKTIGTKTVLLPP